MTRARNTADTQTASGGPVSPSIAGKNAIINGGMDIWQRGTSSTTMTSGYYTADRWKTIRSGTVAGYTVSRQATFQTGTSYAIRLQRTAGNTSTDAMFIAYAVETLDWIKCQGQTMTLSFYAKGGANYSPTSGNLGVALLTGTGTDQDPLAALTGEVSQINANAIISTTATRYSYTFTVPSNSTDMRMYFSIAPTGTAGAADYVDITGVQLELGSSATPFSRAGGSIQGELAACQRYYFRTQTGTGTPYICNTVAGSSTTTYANLIHKVTMRSSPTSVEFSAIKWQAINNSGNITAASISDATPENTLFVCTTTGATAAQMNYVIGQTTAGYMAVSAEL